MKHTLNIYVPKKHNTLDYINQFLIKHRVSSKSVIDINRIKESAIDELYEIIFIQ